MDKEKIIETLRKNLDYNNKNLLTLDLEIELLTIRRDRTIKNIDFINDQLIKINNEGKNSNF